MTDNAFLTFVYPGAEVHLKHFLESLDRQTRRDFVLVIVNDGLETLPLHVEAHPDLRCDVLPVSGLPIAGVRQAGIEYVCGRYRNVVLGDADDYFSSTRVNEVLRQLESCDAVVNDICLVGPDGELLMPDYLSSRIPDRSRVTLDDVIDKNMIGFSNSGFRTSAVDENRSFPPQLVAVDWYFFTCLLASGVNAVFTSGAVTYYRQHADNTIGLGSASREKLSLGVRVKLDHYLEVSARFPELAHRLSGRVQFLQGLVRDSDAMERFIDELGAESAGGEFWWENVRIPD